MKLNPDCIRDVLLYLEENLTIDGKVFVPVTLKTLQENLTGYSKEDVLYSVYNLNQIRFIEGKINDVHDMKLMFCDIENITYNGHQFLNTIRPETIWQATKRGASKLGLMSMHALSTIAMEIAKSVVTDPTVIAKIASLL